VTDSARKASGPSDVVKAPTAACRRAHNRPPSTIVAAAKQARPGDPGLKAITPKPVVRIRGRYTSTGATITLFTVRRPRAATRKLACKGTCPAKTQNDQGRQDDARQEVRARPEGRHEVHATRRPAKGYVSEVTLITIRPQGRANGSGQLHPAW